MKQNLLLLLIAGLCLFMIGGCASKDVVVTKETTAATVKVEQPKVLPAVATPSGKVVNAIAAVVNDEIITLYEVNREASLVIRETEKKSTVDAAARSQIRRTVLDRLVEKKLIEQKVKELNIKVSEEEIRQAIEDVKKQNNMTQEALVSALATQGLSFDLYRSQLVEQLEKLKLVSMEVRSKIQVGESEMREYYEANRNKYTEDETFRARHIFNHINVNIRAP